MRRRCGPGGPTPPAVMIRVAATPSMPDIRTSITTTSGHSSAAGATASAPVPASPTTWSPAVSAISTRSPDRMSGGSPAGNARTHNGPPVHRRDL